MYTEQNIRSCAKDLCILFHGINKINLQAVKKKFSSSKFFKVGLITLEHTSKTDKSKKEIDLQPGGNIDETDIPDEGARANDVEWFIGFVHSFWLIKSRINLENYQML